LTEPHSLAFLRALRRCLRSGLRLASSPASNQLCSRPSWTRFSSSPRLPARRRCLRLSPLALPQTSLAADPWDLHPTLIACSCPPALPSARLAPYLRPCLDLVSGSRPLQYFRPEPATSYRLSILWLPSCPGWTRVLQLPPCGFGLFPGPSVSPSVQSRDCSRGLRYRVLPQLRACAPRFHSTLLPPSGSGARRWVRTHRLLPFLPASLLACLSPAHRLSPLRLRSEAALWHAFDPPSQPACANCSVWPSRWFPELAPLPQPNGYRPLDCASADCSGLAAFASCGCQLPMACGPPGSRSTPACAFANPPSRLLLPAFGLRLAPLWCRPLSPASASPLSLKLGLRLTPTCRVFRSG